jgi:hypothetical protein
MLIDYQKICEDIFQNLTPRKRQILEKRFGVTGENPSTLQAIGDELDITRERVRQIENDAFNMIRETQKAQLEKPFQRFFDYFEEYGGLREETKLLEELGEGKFQNHVLLLLNLGNDFNKLKETNNFFPFWTPEINNIKKAQDVIENIIKEFKKSEALMEIEEVGQKITFNLQVPILVSYIDISKFVFQSPSGYYGLVEWPEINPRGIKDEAYLVLKNENKPIHFVKIAQLISDLPFVSKNILPESVHNELIRNDRFVLIGRGIYA